MSLKDAGGRGITALRLSGGLVAADVALATLLLVGAALTARSLAPLESEDWDSTPDRVLVMRVTAAGGFRGAAVLARMKEPLDDVRHAPDIVSAASVNTPPFSDGAATSLIVEGEPNGDRASWHPAIQRAVSDGFFPNDAHSNQEGPRLRAGGCAVGSCRNRQRSARERALRCAGCDGRTYRASRDRQCDVGRTPAR